MTANELTESFDLIKQAQGGEAEALDRLFGRYYERVRRVVRMRLGSELRAKLESGDILQETFATAVKKFSSFEVRDEASLINWLAKLAERQIHDAAGHHRASKRDVRREVPIGSSEWKGLAQHAMNEGPPDEIESREQEAIVEACIGGLPEELAELIILRNYVGASWETVAELSGRPSADAARALHGRGMIEPAKLLRARGASL